MQGWILAATIISLVQRNTLELFTQKVNGAAGNVGLWYRVMMRA